MEIPEEIWREILSYLSLPYTSRVCRLLYVVEMSLVGERVSRLQSTYRGKNIVYDLIVRKDDDSLRLVAQYDVHFNISYNTLFLYMGTKGWGCMIERYRSLGIGNKEIGYGLIIGDHRDLMKKMDVSVYCGEYMVQSIIHRRMEIFEDLYMRRPSSLNYKHIATTAIMYDNMEAISYIVHSLTVPDIMDLVTSHAYTYHMIYLLLGILSSSPYHVSIGDIRKMVVGIMERVADHKVVDLVAYIIRHNIPSPHISSIAAEIGVYGVLRNDIYTIDTMVKAGALPIDIYVRSYQDDRACGSALSYLLSLCDKSDLILSIGEFII